MEKAAATAFSNVVFGKIISELEKKYKLLKGAKDDCESLKDDLVLLAASMDDELKRGAPGSAVATTYSAVMRDLMHDIEDCIERFLYRVTCKERARASIVRRAFHPVITAGTRLRFAERIKRLKKRLQEAHNRIFNPPGGGQSSSTATEPPAEPPLDHVSRKPHGIEKPMRMIRSLLDQTGDEPNRLRVIVIVGFGGSGKTTLATAVFEEAIASARSSFSCCALVGRREYNDANGLLSKISLKIRQGSDTQNKTPLKDYLSNKRYLIVIDDIDMEHWDVVTSTLEDNCKGSRIIVTTTRQHEANTCRRGLGKGYIHKMSTLGEEDAMKIALPNESPSPELRQGSETLLKKCDGLPLALVSVAKKLSSENEPTGQFCKGLCSELGSYLVWRPGGDSEPHFKRLRGVLMDNYASLSDQTVRACLLYLGIFPIDRPPRMKVVMRRCLAEGYARSEFLERDPKVVTENFKTFIDRNIIQPVLTSSNGDVKTCKAHGIVHEFLLERSKSEKFIMPSCDRGCKKVRHLFVRGNNGTNSTIKFSRVRSLTVFGSAGDAISNFGKYKLMRVLDLEECSDVKDGHLKHICKLWNLRYLSLGPNITMIPKKIKKLKLLETLQVSKTGENVLLPVEVIGLRSLLHLIGKFKLPNQNQNGAVSSKLEQLSKDSNLETLAGFVAGGAVSSKLEQLSKDSNLETLAGFVAGDQSQVFLQLMVHMKKLTKVKIWCEFTGGSDDNSTEHLSRAILEYMKGVDRSLSIDFQRCSEQLQNSLHSLEGNCYLSSLKLHGMLSTLPRFAGCAKDLKKLCLQSTTLRLVVLSADTEKSTTLRPDVLSLNVLSAVMENLLYLELITYHLKEFDIKGAFKSLRRLRLVVNGPNPVLLTIKEGTLPELVALQLHCRRLHGSSSSVIKRLRNLEEIVLVETATVRKEWEDEASNHPNRPNVLTIEMVNDQPAPDQSGIQEQSSPVQTGQENSAEQSSPGDILTSNNSSSGSAGGRDDSTDSEPPEIGPIEEGSKHSFVQMEQEYSMSSPSMRRGFLPNAGNRSLPIHANGDVDLDG